MSYKNQSGCSKTGNPIVVIFKRARGLLADTKLFLGDDSAVAVDVLLHEVVEKTTTLTYEHLKSALCCMIFVI